MDLSHGRLALAHARSAGAVRSGAHRDGHAVHRRRRGRLDGAAVLADHLVDPGCDGIVVNGTTGESPTTTDDEKEQLLGVVVDAVGDAGAGDRRRRHQRHPALDRVSPSAPRRPARTVCWSSRPYYNKPPQDGLIAHFEPIADATELPVMLYDIPAAPASPIETETLVRLAEHARDRRGQGRQGRHRGDVRGDRPDRPRGLLRRRLVTCRGSPIGGRRRGQRRRRTSRRRAIAGWSSLFDAGDVAEARGPARPAAAVLHRAVPHAGRDPRQGGARHARPSRRPGAAAAGRPTDRPSREDLLAREWCSEAAGVARPRRPAGAVRHAGRRDAQPARSGRSGEPPAPGPRATARRCQPAVCASSRWAGSARSAAT